jgi:multidrug efflux pump subunit AcrA (membrane-fusion protein)
MAALVSSYLGRCLAFAIFLGSAAFAGAESASGIRVTQQGVQETLKPIHVTGNILADKTADLTPAVMGIVEIVHVTVGDRVKRGDPLLTVDQAELMNQLERARFAIELAKAEARNAEEELDWGRDLRKTQAISEEQMRDITTRYEVTQARVGIAVAEASMMRGMSGSGALQIQKIDFVVASVFVPEKYVRDISVGTRALVHIPSLGRTIESEIDVINDRIDQKTRTMDVRIRIPNPDYSIKTNLFCSVQLLRPASTASTP